MKRFLLFVALFSPAIFLIGCNQSTDQPKIVIENAWSRPVTVSAQADTSQSAEYTGAVYLKITNNGGIADRLTSAKTDVCVVTEIHRSFIENERMMMEPVSNGIEVPANGSAELKPGGYHLMLMGLKRSLTEGDSFAVQLNFDKSGIKTVNTKIKKF